jgi:creatinine amidohydrolase
VAEHERRLERCRPGQIWEALKEFPCVYVASGPLEWHGRHNPIGLDTLKAHALCLRAVAQSGGLVFPPVYLQAHTVQWPLGMPVPPPQVQANSADIMRYLSRNGARAIVWLSGHGGAEDYLAIRRAALEVMQGADCVIYTVVDQHMISDLERSMDHAAAIETSLLQHLEPDTVDLTALDPAPDVWPQGVGGEDPRTHASAAKGREYTELLVTRLVEVARRLVTMDDPILQRRHRQCVAQQVALDDMVVYGRANLASDVAPPKEPSAKWSVHLEAFRTGDYEAAIEAGTAVIDEVRRNTAGTRPAGSEDERVL